MGETYLTFSPCKLGLCVSLNVRNCRHSVNPLQFTAGEGLTSEQCGPGNLGDTRSSDVPSAPSHGSAQVSAARNTRTLDEGGLEFIEYAETFHYRQSFHHPHSVLRPS